jgi:hypothetical protein
MSHFSIIVDHRCHDIITDGGPELESNNIIIRFNIHRAYTVS